MLTDNLVVAAKGAGQTVKVNYSSGYNHSYFYITGFIEEHIKFHLAALSD